MKDSVKVILKTNSGEGPSAHDVYMQMVAGTYFRIRSRDSGIFDSFLRQKISDEKYFYYSGGGMPSVQSFSGWPRYTLEEIAVEIREV